MVISDSHLITHTFVITLMRYIPSSRYTFDEIVDQCRAAVNRPSQSTPAPASVDYSEVRKFYHYDENAGQVFRMKDYPSLVR